MLRAILQRFAERRRDRARDLAERKVFNRPLFWSRREFLKREFEAVNGIPFDPLDYNHAQTMNRACRIGVIRAFNRPVRCSPVSSASS